MTLRPVFYGALTMVALSGCQPTVAERGNMVDPDKLTQVKGGMSKDDVAKLLGSPTTIGTFDDNYWYYMGQRTEQESFFDPEITDRRVVEVDFDETDKVTGVKLLGKDQGESVDIVDQETPAQGHETTLAEELFGRGGFGSDKNKKKKSDTGGT